MSFDKRDTCSVNVVVSVAVSVPVDVEVDAGNVVLTVDADWRQAHMLLAAELVVDFRVLTAQDLKFPEQLAVAGDV